ncbi:hypothetical protein QO002_005382 [Pararhizobium capsulatum DSM 1112]|uniref:Uncharacterized protein n=1 Tax=Pararhizobium capsulatum DSM 1112 TaxID=1121113 RepID=A0ABU0BY38_9HYPH|nr:hypothetical protein [Pararhizobium capsulatum DSM 1112]
MIDTRTSFIFETTLSSQQSINLMRDRIPSSRRLEREAGRNVEAMADRTTGSGSQNHSRFPQRQWPCNP